MKAKLNKSDLSNLKVSKNKKEFKKVLKKDKDVKRSKKVKNVTIQPDDEFDKQLQDEVRMFLNNSQMLSDNDTASPGKTTKKGKLVDDDNNNSFQCEHKLLNQNKYNTKVLKKGKLKQTNVMKLEKRKKKLKALIQNNADQDSSANDSLSEQQIQQMEDKIDRKIKKLKENSGEGKVQKKQEKVEMKQLFKKFDKLDIDQDQDHLSKKSRKKAKFLKLQENSENLDEWKKNKKLARKLKKKEKQLQKQLNEKQMLAVDSESKENEKAGQKKKSKKEKKKKPIHDEEETSQPNKKKQKVNVDKVIGQINKMDLDETEDKLNKNNKDKKKKKSKKNHVKEDEIKVNGSNNENNETMSQSMQFNTISSAAGGHKKEKYFNSKHTPLREKLMNKLKAARFRYLNEQLYTSKSEESKDFFLKDPESFEAYHEGFKKQVTQWPINPIDIIIKSIEERESSERLVIADLGCGEAKLAASLVQHKVHSLDLVAINERVTPCDMTHTPLKTGSVDVVVFCLSLMGIDLAACIKEANRVLKLGGEMKIAEVESRFTDVKDFIKDIQKYGFEKKVFNEDYSIFYFMDFKKVSNLSKTKKKKLPPINLKPCLYKKR
uniref:Ribosomal RNA-processing protein 8 n=1 Tax=Cacopsylla melanoneura TaxID=428564 RepID=A0A8D9EKA6_9HEMI